MYWEDNGYHGNESCPCVRPFGMLNLSLLISFVWAVL